MGGCSAGSGDTCCLPTEGIQQVVDGCFRSPLGCIVRRHGRYRVYKISGWIKVYSTAFALEAVEIVLPLRCPHVEYLSL